MEPLHSKISIDLSRSSAVINPNLHGHFIEHIGTCIYDGIWVGPDSAIPNINGIRKDVVEALQAIQPPVLRWPGGCFADQYHWRDGIGPRENRPSQVTSRWGPDEVERNEFGTHEFMELCRLIGAEPWLGGNVATGSPKELRDWAEYCNFPSATTLAEERAANGSPEPFDVRFWGIGNESWDCGGKFMPAPYADAYRLFESNFPSFYEQEISLIACGPDGNRREERAEWTQRFFERLSQWRRPRLHGYDAHFYTWNSDNQAGTSTDFTEDQWYQLLAEGMKIEEMILEQRRIMDVYDPERKIDLIIGEWGNWHKGNKDDPLLWQQNSMRDAVVAAIHLEIFHKHADIVKMANLAQTINILHSLILTRGERMIVTPTYYVFMLYQGHKGGEKLELTLDAPPLEWPVGSGETIPSLMGTASIKDGIVTLSIVNLHANEPVEAEICCPAAGDARWSVRQLAHPDRCAHNTFEDPDKVKLSVLEDFLTSSNSCSTFRFPPASITVFTSK